MCTKAETAQVIEHEFFKKDGLKDRLLKDMKKQLNADFTKWLVGGGLLIILGASAAWFSLYFQVQANSIELDKREENVDEISVIKFQVQQNAATLKSIDDRLRENGI